MVGSLGLQYSQRPQLQLKEQRVMTACTSMPLYAHHLQPSLITQKGMLRRGDRAGSVIHPVPFHIVALDDGMISHLQWLPVQVLRQVIAAVAEVQHVASKVHILLPEVERPHMIGREAALLPVRR
eukprot:GHUV01036210.1.p1 GENE.GHUV01036210.1~~GHUV01036210.1.p1  ORF type:complete len:125 (+),score=23.69 GHUV01036210.1:146-520(+)